MSYRAGEDERDVRVAADDITLEGTLLMPPQAQGMVLFAHGSGSSRHSPRNRFVAEQLREGALGSLLLDLLTVEEEAIDERTLHLRFDIGLLADRLIHAIEWLGRQPETSGLPLGRRWWMRWFPGAAVPTSRATRCRWWRRRPC